MITNYQLLEGAAPPESYVNVTNYLKGLDLLKVMITNYQLLEGAGPPKSYHVNDTNYLKGCGVYQ